MKRKFSHPKQPCHEIGLNKEMLLLFQKMIDAVQSSFIGYSQQIAGLTLQMLGLINTMSVNNQYDKNPVEKAIAKAMFLLQESLERCVDMPDLARQLLMSYSAFRKKFKAMTGLSPNQYHLNLRITRAQELLESTLLNIEEVADQTGFENIYYFSKIFKKKVGTSPKVYRKQFF
jgi:AraC-like DNA-binding protein